MATQSPIDLSERRRKDLGRLIEISHKKPMDLNTSIPWYLGVQRTLPPKRETSCWIYGTRHWMALNAQQRHELLWEETARDVSMFIWLEQALPPLFMGYVNTFGEVLPKVVLDYLMVFSKEEIVHTMVFRRYMSMAGLKMFRPPVELHELFTKKLPTLLPPAGILCTLIVEYVAELAAMHSTQHDGVDPLTRAMFMRHHLDESRHIAFGRWISESFFETADQATLLSVRHLACSLFQRTVAQYSFNAEISERISIDLGAADSIFDIRNSAYNKLLNRERFAEIDSWLVKLGVLQ